MRELLTHFIGGGWGSEEPREGYEPVQIIRGADFPTVSVGSMTGSPLRYEASKKVPKRVLEPGDIVLEVSGGTKDRPTGRTVFASDRLLERAAAPVIPASFCRLLRPDAERVVPAYLYYWLQNLYAQGGTWKYQVQSTGIANFQMKMFLDSEKVRSPPLDEQRRIASVLGAFDDLIEANRRSIQQVRDLSRTFYATLTSEANQSVLLGEVARVSDTKTKPSTGTLRYIDIAALGDGYIELPEPINWADAPSRAQMKATDGSTLWSTVRPNRRAHSLLVEVPEDVVISTGIAVLTPEKIGPAELFAATDTDRFIDQLVALAEGSAYPAVRPRAFKEQRILSLPQALSQRFERTMWPLWLDAQAAADENADLTQTRDELLPLLMSGKVRVEDVEIPEGAA